MFTNATRGASLGALLALCKVYYLLLQCILPFSAITNASPLLRVLKEGHHHGDEDDDDLPMDPDNPDLWIYLGIAVFLVLLGGAFAGLTIALMGQDEIYLQVTAASGEGKERKHAASVLKLLKRGKHWVLVTLLLGNVIVNETLPIILDRSLGGGWAAVVISTTAIVIFGEIAPQSICVRYGLPIGAFCSTPVLILMWLMSPIAWPIAKLLDYLLGEDHGTIYKKAGLKTLMTLHRQLGTTPDERLNKDEVTIISAVLDLKAKSIGSVMTPMDDVFTLSSESVLDQDTVEKILAEGYSRIPVHVPGNSHNFIGMLLVKMLISYDPEDCSRVQDFQLATLPETRPETSCLDILNFFQEGKSHMILVSEFPGDDHGALGVVTLEDVVEEMIGEEIIDESDVYVDVHKAIRRMQPAPLRVPKGEFVEQPPSEAGREVGLDNISDVNKRHSTASLRPTLTADGTPGSRKTSSAEAGKAGHGVTLTRRASGGTGDPTSIRFADSELREHLKHLGPSNLASRPKATRINTVKIKPGLGGSDSLNNIPENRQLKLPVHRSISNLRPDRPQSLMEHDEDSETTSLLPKRPMSSSGGESTGLLSAGKDASDGVHAVNYGTVATSPTSKSHELPARLRGISDPGYSIEQRLSEAEPPSEQTSPKSQPRDSPKAPKPAEKHSGELLISLEGPALDQPKEEVGQVSIEIPGHDGAQIPIQVGTPPKESAPSATNGQSQQNGSSPGVPPKLVIKLERTQSQITEVPDNVSDVGSLLSSQESNEADNNGGLKPAERQTRSGSIMEHEVNVGGYKKVVLDITSSSEDQEDDDKQGGPVGEPEKPEQAPKKKMRGTRGGAKVKEKAEKKRRAAEKKEAESSAKNGSLNGGVSLSNREDGPSANGSNAAPSITKTDEGKTVKIVAPEAVGLADSTEDLADGDDLPDDVDGSKKKKTRRGGKKVTARRQKSRDAAAGAVSPAAEGSAP